MTIGFTMRKVKDAKTLGERLSQAREKLHLPLDRISQDLIIRREYLEYLERGEYSKLPSDVYVKGFLKNYSQYLGLPQAEILDLYLMERGISENIKKAASKEKTKKIKTGPSIIITPRIFKIALIVLIVFGAFFYLWLQVSRLATPPPLTIISPVEDITTKGDIIEIYGQTIPETSVFINGQLIETDRQGKFKESVGLQKGLNIIQIKAENKLGRATQVERKIISTD